MSYFENLQLMIVFSHSKLTWAYLIQCWPSPISQKNSNSGSFFKNLLCSQLESTTTLPFKRLPVVNVSNNYWLVEPFHSLVIIFSSYHFVVLYESLYHFNVDSSQTVKHILISQYLFAVWQSFLKYRHMIGL